MRFRSTHVIPALLLLAAACGPMVRYERGATVRVREGAGWAWGAPDNDGLTLREGALIPEDSVARLISDAIEASHGSVPSPHSSSCTSTSGNAS